MRECAYCLHDSATVDSLKSRRLLLLLDRFCPLLCIIIYSCSSTPYQSVLTMAEMREPSLRMGQPRPCSPTAADERRPSMLFRFLPSAVQTRVPQLSSLRSTLSGYDPRTHPPPNVFPQHDWSQGLEVGFVEQASVTSSPELSRPPSRSSPNASASPEVYGETAPSREWRYATNGNVVRQRSRSTGG